eukprot:m.367125 g.367125  ORF g.367125 m.367125 type:complete len:51 (-) comp39304_c0_seq1:72-224(-)
MCMCLYAPLYASACLCLYCGGRDFGGQTCNRTCEYIAPLALTEIRLASEY